MYICICISIYILLVYVLSIRCWWFKSKSAKPFGNVSRAALTAVRLRLWFLGERAAVHIAVPGVHRADSLGVVLVASPLLPPGWYTKSRRLCAAYCEACHTP